MDLAPAATPEELDALEAHIDAWPAAESQTPTFFAPRVDIHEADGHYEITAELPGVDKKDIHVHVKDGVLTLEAESSREDKEEKEGRVIRQERRYGKFRRVFQLPDDIKTDKIDASFKNGVLSVSLPKLETVKPKQIEVKIS